jgi:hypothetical protein
MCFYMSQSPEMRSQLLKLGISQMSAGSRTDVGAYHREKGKDADAALVCPGGVHGFGRC